MWRLRKAENADVDMFRSLTGNPMLSVRRDAFPIPALLPREHQKPIGLQ